MDTRLAHLFIDKGAESGGKGAESGEDDVIVEEDDADVFYVDEEEGGWIGTFITILKMQIHTFDK